MATAPPKPRAPPTGVSDEMRALFDNQKRLHESVLRLQRQIEEEEALYLEDTVHGNIVRGWDGFVDSKPSSRKDANPKKIKPYAESEHLFSGCCQYAELAAEPSFDLVDYNNSRDEASGRRRLTVTLSGGAKISSEVSSSNHGSGLSVVGSGSSSASHAHQVASKLLGKSAERGRTVGGHHTGKGGKAGSGAGPKPKKRKRDQLQLSAASSDASAAVSAEEDNTADGTASSSSVAGTPVRSRAGSVEDTAEDAALAAAGF